MHGYIERLQKAGLTGNEAKVYLELLRKGSLSANEIAKKIGMDRTLAYTVLNHLLDKGMVNYVIRQNKKFFQAAEPEHLLNPVKEKEALVKDLVKELKEIESIEEATREVNVYEGNEGMRTVLKNFYFKYKEVDVFGSTGRAYDLLYDVPHLAEEFKKKKIKTRVIITTKYKSHQMIKLDIIQFRYFDFKAEATTVIGSDAIAIFYSLHKPMVIVIKNKDIAESYRNHFEVLWKAAKKI